MATATLPSQSRWLLVASRGCPLSGEASHPPAPPRAALTDLPLRASQIEPFEHPTLPIQAWLVKLEDAIADALKGEADPVAAAERAALARADDEEAMESELESSSLEPAGGGGVSEKGGGGVPSAASSSGKERAASLPEAEAEMDDAPDGGPSEMDDAAARAAARAAEIEGRVAARIEASEAPSARDSTSSSIAPQGTGEKGGEATPWGKARAHGQSKWRGVLVASATAAEAKPAQAA